MNKGTFTSTPGTACYSFKVEIKMLPDHTHDPKIVGFLLENSHDWSMDFDKGIMKATMLLDKRDMLVGLGLKHVE